MQFIKTGGQTNETYEDYFSQLVDNMKIRYPGKRLVFQHDNLLSHKSSLIMKVIQADRLEMIFSPSHTPEFSAIENIFADLKRQLGTF